MPGPDALHPVSDDPRPGADPRPGPSSADAEPDTEAAILDAARDLLASGGMGALSMRAVAKRIGLSATAIYHWFQSKDALVDRVVQRGFERSEEYLRRSVADHPRGSLERVAALGEAYIRFALEHRQYFKIIFAIQGEQPRSIRDVPGHGGYLVLRESVVEAMESGAMREEDPDVVVLFLWATVHGLVTIFMACDPGELIDETGLCGGPCRNVADATLALFARFRELVRLGLEPGAAGSRP